jgi:hypothetical protein
MKSRLFRQILFAVLAWVLFVYYWSLVAQRRLTDSTVQALQILVLCVALIWLVTALWVQHNRRRFAGRPDRRQRRTAPGELAPVDAIGQAVSLDEAHGALPRSAYVVVEVDAETRTKTFRSEPVPDGEEQP